MTDIVPYDRPGQKFAKISSKSLWIQFSKAHNLIKILLDDGDFENETKTTRNMNMMMLVLGWIMINGRSRTGSSSFKPLCMFLTKAELERERAEGRSCYKIGT